MANKPGKVSTILQDMIRLIEEGEWGLNGRSIKAWNQWYNKRILKVDLMPSRRQKE